MASSVKPDAEDKVVREMDVFLSESLELFLLQFPLKPVFSEYPDISAAKMRPKHGRIELDIKTPGDRNGPNKAGTTKLSSIKISQQSCMGIGVVQNGEFHITPVSSVVQLRPSFENLKPREEVQDMSSGDEDEGTGDAEPASAPLQQVSLRRKESERAESSRVQSFSFLQAQEEAEAWVPLRVFDPDSNESQDVFGGLFYEEEAAAGEVVQMDTV